MKTAIAALGFAIYWLICQAGDVIANAAAHLGAVAF